MGGKDPSPMLGNWKWVGLEEYPRGLGRGIGLQKGIGRKGVLPDRKGLGANVTTGVCSDPDDDEDEEDTGPMGRGFGFGLMTTVPEPVLPELGAGLPQEDEQSLVSGSDLTLFDVVERSLGESSSQEASSL